LTAAQVARLNLYVFIAGSGVSTDNVQLPSANDIIACYSTDEEKLVAGLRAGRCGTWLEEQNILCRTKEQVALYLLKAQITSLLSTLERARLQIIGDTSGLSGIHRKKKRLAARS